MNRCMGYLLSIIGADSRKKKKDIRYVRYREGSQMYRMTFPGFLRLAWEAGAVCETENRPDVVDLEILDAHILMKQKEAKDSM